LGRLSTTPPPFAWHPLSIQLRDQAWPDRRDRAWALRDGALRRVFHGGVLVGLATPHKFFSLTGKT
jgi:hypothetical protein